MMNEASANSINLPYGEWITHDARSLAMRVHDVDQPHCITMLVDDSLALRSYKFLLDRQDDHHVYSPLALPVCWLSSPDDMFINQKPVPPMRLDIDDFRETLCEWRERVANCLEDFFEVEDYVDHLLYTRTYLEMLATRHPAFKLRPEWIEVLILDDEFRAQAARVCKKYPEIESEWPQQYQQWWLRAGWSIFVAVHRDIGLSPEGVECAAARANEEAAHKAFFTPTQVAADEYAFGIKEPPYLNTHALLPLGSWVLHWKFGPGVIRAQEVSDLAGEAVVIRFAHEGLKTLALQYAKLTAWQPATRSEECMLLRRLGVPDDVIERDTFEEISIACAAGLGFQKSV